MSFVVIYTENSSELDKLKSTTSCEKNRVLEGFGPTTPHMLDRCLNQLSHRIGNCFVEKKANPIQRLHHGCVHGFSQFHLN